MRNKICENNENDGKMLEGTRRNLGGRKRKIPTLRRVKYNNCGLVKSYLSMSIKLYATL